MVINTKRFGEIIAEEQEIIQFPAGLLAFENLVRFALLDISNNPVFKWLQSIEAPEIAFLLVDPFVFKRDYYLDLDPELTRELEIKRPEDVLVYTTVTIPEHDFKQATTNLVGPLVINRNSKRGKQVVLDKEGLAVKYPLFSDYRLSGRY
ncbi:MAG: flagellar assembly protein FliW [Syntrophomonadaceae bacterium]|jgi:flagellar assembly factor FliW